PGSFVLTGFYLARRQDGKTHILLPPPADLVISKDEEGTLHVSRLAPQPIGLPSSFPLAMLPVLAQGVKRGKPESGYWLTEQGWAAYLQGQTPSAEHLLHSAKLWRLDPRVGIGMSTDTGSVE